MSNTQIPTKICQKKLMKYKEELLACPNENYIAKSSLDNILEWHILIWNLQDAYKDGQYIMEIIFPYNYPFKAPSIKFLTPNGKFEINKHICLSNTEYHQESWSPLWGINEIVLGIISLFYEETTGIGHIKRDDSNCIELAHKSTDYNKNILSKYNDLFFM